MFVAQSATQSAAEAFDYRDLGAWAQANFILLLCAVPVAVGHQQGTAQAFKRGIKEACVQASVHHGYGQ